MKRNIIIAFLVLQIFTSCEKDIIGDDAENTPENNFELLYKAFDENYAQFEVKHINWDSLHHVYSLKINSKTTDEELWNLISDLILNLNDGHVNVFSQSFNKSISGSPIVRNRKADDFSIELIKEKYLSDYRIAGGGYFVYGHIKNAQTGYIYIASFASLNPGNMSAWAYDIDKALSSLADCKNLILDVRNNGGGLIVNEHIIASAFIDKPITYLYSRRKTGKAHKDLSDPIPVTVYPREEIMPYNKSVVLLTNRFTGSGSEYLTQISKSLPNFTQIGDTTFGAFGEVINISELPNGWTFRYPCTLTTLPNGVCLEGIGIVPDILIRNTKIEIENSTDKQIDYAIDYLK